MADFLADFEGPATEVFCLTQYATWGIELRSMHIHLVKPAHKVVICPL